MGATGWTYFVAYQPDAERALQELRKDVFTRRAYTLPGDLLEGLSDQAIAAAMPSIADLRKLLKVARAVDQAMKGLGADTESAEKDTKGVEQFIQEIETHGAAKAARRAAGAKRKKSPTSIEHAREMAGEAGTHSILDIASTAAVRGFGLATPLLGDELLALLGTDKPTQAMARQKEQAGVLATLRDRWEAVYFTVFEGEKPAGIVFCGCSGD
jgi:hypothetical protein